MIFAQTPPVDPLGGYSGIAQLGAVAVNAALLIYIVVRVGPNLIEKIIALQESFADVLKVQRDDFATELRNDRDAFREELKSTRDQSNRLATGGHEAVNNLAKQVEALRESKN